MQRLPLSYIRPGMKTFEEVVDAQGRVLCGKGVELTESMLQKFQELGVSYITVEGTPVKLPWEKTLEEELELLEKRFSGVKDEFLLHVKEVLKEVLMMKYPQGAKNG
jgi:hypothetical protein